MLIIKIDKPTKEDFLTWFKFLDDMPWVDPDDNEPSYYQKNKDKWEIYKERTKLGIRRSTSGRYKEFTDEEKKEKQKLRSHEYYHRVIKKRNKGNNDEQ